ncbi:hypothetical protein J1614_004049 [Plenodomus biglobosus]|nr:hypothetical protein J1614_004049 [Plenodomus biglobosus]
MFSTPVHLVSILAFTATGNPTTTITLSSCPPTLGAKGVQVRLPPSLDPNPTQSKWHAPPPTWYFKPWHMIYASNRQYTAFRNLQYEPSPINPGLPSSHINDLFSFQLPGHPTIYTTYGVDTPHPEFPGVLQYNATGVLAGATSEYSLLAWGCDDSAVPYYASYSSATRETRTPAGIDVMSVSVGGPDAGTLAAVVGALAGLGSGEVRELVGGLQRMIWDGEREGMGKVSCHAILCCCDGNGGC